MSQQQPQQQQGPWFAASNAPSPSNMKRPTPEQIAEMQRRLAEDAHKASMSVPQFIEHLKKQAMEQQQLQQQRQQQHDHSNCGHDHSHDGHDPTWQPVTPGPPSPKALALAKFLRHQDLKTRTCILNGERKEIFKGRLRIPFENIMAMVINSLTVKRALRAMQSPAYEKARKKNPLLPEVKDHISLENAFKLLPFSMLALRVSKIEPESAANGKKPKRVKGQWNVRIEQQQEAEGGMYYAWLYEGSQIKRQLYAALALVVIFIIVLYPLWPLKLRQGVYYLSWGLLGLLGLFFAMAIFRVILFCITYFAVPPGLWLYPKLWEDVSFIDSFRPVWAWHETAEEKKLNKKKKLKKSKGPASISGTNAAFAVATGQGVPAMAITTSTDTQVMTGPTQRRNYSAPKVEDIADDE